MIDAILTNTLLPELSRQVLNRKLDGTPLTRVTVTGTAVALPTPSSRAMQIHSTTRYLSQFTSGLDVAGREHVSLVIKGTFDFPAPGETARRARTQRPLIFADEYAGRPGFAPPVWETDFAFRKPTCDVVAQGAAYAPDGTPAERVRVGLRVGSWVKQFDVVGPRQWRTLGPAISATRPLPVYPACFRIRHRLWRPGPQLAGR